MNRRHFLATTAATLTAPAFAATDSASPLTVVTFSKPFRHLGPEETADLVEEVGWDGLEMPIRGGATHLDPARAADQLPKFIEALRARGKSIEIVTTDILRPDAAAEKLLRTLAANGIRHYRTGSARYPADRPLPEFLEEVAAGLRDLAALNAEIGITGGYQNHSGSDYVGGPVWDLWTILRDLDPAHLGCHFDIGHATLEGGHSWPLQARLMEPFRSAVYVKDFQWFRNDDGVWKTRWCDLGEGRIHSSWVAALAKSGFRGPLSLHEEHLQLKDDRAGFIETCRKDLATLRGWLG